MQSVTAGDMVIEGWGRYISTLAGVLGLRGEGCRAPMEPLIGAAVGAEASEWGPRPGVGFPGKLGAPAERPWPSPAGTSVCWQPGAAAIELSPPSLRPRRPSIAVAARRNKQREKQTARNTARNTAAPAPGPSARPVRIDRTPSSQGAEHLCGSPPLRMHESPLCSSTNTPFLRAAIGQRRVFLSARHANQAPTTLSVTSHHGLIRRAD